MNSLSRQISRLLRGLVVGFGLTVFLMASAAASTSPPVDGATEIDDVSATRQIQLLTAGLAVAGVGLAAITFWFWRNTRPDPEALGSLDVMSQRRWRRQDPDERSRALALARLEDVGPVIEREQVDLAALAAGRGLPSLDDHAGFGDLVDVAIAAEGRTSTPVGEGPASTVQPPHGEELSVPWMARPIPPPPPSAPSVGEGPVMSPAPPPPPPPPLPPMTSSADS